MDIPKDGTIKEICITVQPQGRSNFIGVIDAVDDQGTTRTFKKTWVKKTAAFVRGEVFKLKKEFIAKGVVEENITVKMVS